MKATTTQAAAPNKICLCCAQPFTAKRLDAKACSPACRKALSRASQIKRDDKRLTRFYSSAIGQYLVGQCKRAGTVAVLPRTLEALIELYSVHAYAIRANNFGAANDYSICHISPVTQKAHMGTLHPHNLAVAPTKLNAGFGNKSFPNAGHRILKAKLNPAHRVGKEDTKAAVLDAIVSYLTPALICQWVVKCSIQCTQKAKLIDWLTTNELAIDDDRVPSLSALHDLTGKQLSDLQAELTGKNSGFKVDGYVFYPYDVFRHELQRLAKHSAPLAELQSTLFSRGYSVGFVSGFQFSSDADAIAQFNALHGGPVDELLSLFPAPAQQHKAPTTAVAAVRAISPAAHNAWLRDLEATFPELAAEYEYQVEADQLEQLEAQAPVVEVISAPLVAAPATPRKPLLLPWQVGPKAKRSSFADSLDSLDAINDDDDADDWQHLEAYLHAPAAGYSATV